MDNADSFALAGGRILLALVFIVAAVGKITGYAAALAYLSGFAIPAPALVLPLVVAFELAAGIALLVGFRARAAAAALAAYTAATGVVFHTAWSEPGQLVLFMQNAGLLGGLLIVAGLGGGACSLDNRDRLAESPEA